MKKLSGHVKRQYSLPQRHLELLDEVAEAVGEGMSVSDLVRSSVAEKVEKLKKSSKCVVCQRRERFKDSWLCKQCIQERQA